MYAEDTTIYVAESSPDKVVVVLNMVVVVLNSVLQKLYEWCRRNCLIPHCGKTECMILMRSQFVGPLQAVSLGNSVVTQVKSTRCLGVELDSDLNWNVLVKELTKSFTQKLNLLRSLYFLPVSARADFYFKVILPSVTYGLVVWDSCGKSLIDVLEKIHVRDQVLARCNWFTINCLYYYRLFLLAPDCFMIFHQLLLSSYLKNMIVTTNCEGN